MAIAYERRLFGRRTSNAMAWIIVPGRPRLNCRIANISVKGAMLEFIPPAWLPFNFTVLIEGSAESIPCQIRHMVPHGVGVNFSQHLSEHQIPACAPTIEQFQQWTGKKTGAKRAASARERHGEAKL